MVVDDNQDAAESLTMLLGIDGHDARVAFNGRTALALAAEFKPEIALLDIGMPDMDGYALARALRQTDGGAALYLVAVTGWGQQEDRARSDAAGFNRHLTKPVDPDDLSALLVEFLPPT
jgi:CheY-like chemotaxis protein